MATDATHDYTGKKVLVTGGTRGLGREMALGFARAGADVAVASRKQDACEAMAAEISALGRRGFGYSCHVGDWDQLEPLVDRVWEDLGGLDVLVNNAGMSPLYPSLVEVSEALFDKVVAVNLKGPFRLSALVGTRMAEGTGGAILNVSSVAAVRPSPHAEPYGSVKAGVNALTRSLAFAYGPKVRVNCLQAGPFLTDVSKHWDMAAFEDSAGRGIALQRGGNPDEIVGAALYLCSTAASYTTGAVLAVDGGSR